MTSEEFVTLIASALDHVHGATIASVPADRPEGNVVQVRLPPSLRLGVFADPDFPLTPPSLYFADDDGASYFVPVEWQTSTAPIEQLKAVFQSLIDGAGEFRIAWGEIARYPLVDDVDLARRSAWRRLATSHPSPPLLKDSIGERVGTGLTQRLQQSSVAIFGLGSVGSYLAEQLARTGVGKITGADFDSVESHNLTRTIYDFSDVGRPKADALARRLHALRPDMAVDLRASDVTRMSGAELRPMFEEADLVIAATDQPFAQSRVNLLARASGRAAVFIGLYRGAHGGEVVFSVPGLTPCYECATGARHALPGSDELQAPRDPSDYGRIAGEIALVADIHHVASAALRISISLMAAMADPTSAAADLVTGAMARRHSMVMFGMDADYSLFPTVLANASGQYVFQSVWLNAEPQADCHVCGPVRDADFDPFDHDVLGMTPDERDRLRRLARL